MPSKLATEEPKALNNSYVRSLVAPTSCMICIEDFSDITRAPGRISQECRHKPAVCTGCISRSIKIDLETKIWDQIKCPECKILLNYDDIKRLADPVTFSRYALKDDALARY